MGRRIVTLCGSTRFKDEFEQANKDLTLKGYVVLSVGYFGHKETTPPTNDQKRMLDQLHLDKIEMSHEILVLNVGGYIGYSLTREIAYAAFKHKKVVFLEPDKVTEEHRTACLQAMAEFIPF